MRKKAVLTDTIDRPISLKINPELYHTVKVYCAEQQITMKKFIETLIKKFFEKKSLPKIR